MKKFNIITILLAAASLLLAGCQEEYGLQADRTPVVDVTNSKLDPNTDESGTVRAIAGLTQVTVAGFNLDLVGLVTLDGIEAPIMEQSIRKLVFEVPSLPAETYPQRDDPYSMDLNIYDADKTTVVFRYSYYVTVPVTDAIVTGFEPKSGTVGDIVSISGRNLDQISSVTFNGVAVAYADFSESSADVIRVPVPAIPAENASTEVSITAIWGGDNAIDVTGTEKFILNVPVFDTFAQSGTIALAEEITLTGQNLGLCSGFRWGDAELIIISASEDGTSATVKFPNSIEGVSGGDETAVLTAYYGTPEQTVTVAESVTVNTAPVGAEKPEFEAVAPADASYKNIYLGNRAVITGAHMSTVEKIIIDGIEVTDLDVQGDGAVEFTVPSAITGTEAREVTLSAEYDGGNPVEFPAVTVYPFYHVKGLRLGVGAGASTSDYGYANSFLMLDRLAVISADEWASEEVDPYYKSSANTSSQNKVTVIESEYNSVEPYTFITASSASKLAFQNPTNSSSQIRNFFRNDENLYLSVYGTPMVYFRVVSDNDELKASAGEETLTDIVYNKNCGAAAPAFGTSEGSSEWIKGSVIAVAYINYAQATVGKPDDLSDVSRCGYIVIRDVTAADATTGLANEDRTGYVEFDFYWSNPLN